MENVSLDKAGIEVLGELCEGTVEEFKHLQVLNGKMAGQVVCQLEYEAVVMRAGEREVVHGALTFRRIARGWLGENGRTYEDAALLQR